MRIKSNKNKLKLNTKAITKKKDDVFLSSEFKKENLNGESVKNVEEKILEINLDIDKKEYLNSDIEKIEVLLSKQPANVALKKDALNKNLDKGNLSPKSVNLKFKNVGKIRRRNINEKNKSVMKLTEISPDKIIDASVSSLKKINKLSDEELFGTSVKYIPVKVKNNSSIRQKKNQIETQSKFSRDINEEKEKQGQSNLKKELKKIKRQKQDLGTLINESITNSTPQSTLQRIKGVIDSGDKNTSSLNNELTKKVKNLIEKKSLVKNNNYVIEKKKIANKIETVTKRIKIENNKLKKITNEKDVHLLYQIKDKKGKVLKTISSKIDLTKQKKEIDDIPELKFKISAFRRNNKIYVKASNLGNKPSIYNIYQKKNYDLFSNDEEEFNIISRKIKINPKTTKTIELANHGGESVFRMFEVSKSEIEYSNFSSFSISSTLKNNISFHPGMISKVNHLDNKIMVYVKNLPNSQEISGVQLFKRNLTKKQKNYSKVVDIKNENLENITSRPGENFSLIDDDVQNGEIYEYKLKLYDLNKNHFFSGSTLIEEYETKTGIVGISFIQQPKINKNIMTMTLNTEILKNDADRLFESLFGNLYDLFKEDVKEIKDINSLSIILEISMFNTKTGEMVEVGTFNVDENRRTRVSVFLPENYDYYQEYCIKIKPKIAPPADLLSTISNRIKDLGVKENFNPVAPFSTAAIKKRLKEKENEIISSVGNKFTSRMSRKKGKIEDNETFINRTGLDFYFDGSTGDQTYYNLSPVNSIEETFLTKFKIEKLSQKNKRLTYNKKQKIENNVQIKINALYDYNQRNNIDFFIAAYEENGVIKEEGLAYTKNKNFNFLYEILSPVGEVKFLFIPVFKDGSFGDRIEAGIKYFDSDGEITHG